MSSSKFRLFVVLFLLTAIAGIAIEIFFQAKVPDQLNRDIGRLPGQPSDIVSLVGAVIGLISGVMSFVATFAMLAFKPWAPRIALTSTFMSTLALTLVGATLTSSAASALSFASIVFWGCILAIAHTPMYRGYSNPSVEN